MAVVLGDVERVGPPKLGQRCSNAERGKCCLGPRHASSILLPSREAHDHAPRGLLNRDGCDKDEVLGFDVLAAKPAELVEPIVVMPAQSRTGLHARANCARLRSP